MAWFIGRSVVVIVLAFLLGLLVGWLWWRRRKVHFGESQAIAKVTAAQQTRVDELSAKLARAEARLRDRTEELDARRADLVDRDDEIARLRAAANAAPATAAPATAAPATAVVDLTDTTTGADSAAGIDGAPSGRGLVDVSSGSATWSAESPAPTAAPAAPAATAAPASFVSAPTDPAPEVFEPLATPVDEISTAGHEASAESVAAAEAAAGPVAAHPVPAEATAEPVVAEPAADEGTDGADDDLERIEGIGPRIGAALRGAGIHTFSQLAEADTSTLQGALEQAGLRFAPSLPTWSRQARLLADGDEAGFLELTQQLLGGRDVSGTK